MNEISSDTAKPVRISPRILTAIMGIPVVLALVQLGGWWLIGFVFLLSAIAFHELVAATRTSSTRIESFMLPFVALVFYFFFFSNVKDLSLAEVPLFVTQLLALILVLLTVSPLATAVMHYATRRAISLLSLALTIFAALYISLFAFIPALQSLPQGRTLLWLTLFCVWTGDTLAYFGGRRFGKTKLTPLSPGKSREGALCGFVGSIIIGVLIGRFSSISWTHGIALGALVGVFAPLGDLAESFWKRELGVKDLGTILPGHGGVLDRCDSLLFAAPVAYFYAKTFLK